MKVSKDVVLVSKDVVLVSKDVVLYLIIGVVVFVGVFSLYFWYQNTYFGSSYQKAMSAEQADICATPPGYTDASWRQHMSHHPDRYKECLK